MFFVQPARIPLLTLLAGGAALVLGAGCQEDSAETDPTADITAADTFTPDGIDGVDGADGTVGDTSDGTSPQAPSWRDGVAAAEHVVRGLRVAAIPLADIDGDGRDEIGIFDEADDAGVLRIHDPSAGTGDRDSARLELSGFGPGTSIGAQLHAAAGDFDGDGTPDLAVTYPAWEDPAGEDRDGAIAIFFGPFDADRTVADADRIVRYGKDNDLSDIEAIYTANLNGDGIDDLVLERGIDVRLIAGPFDVDADGPYSIDANAIALDHSESSFPTSIAIGDFTGDGLDDVAVGDVPAIRSDASVDAVYVFHAPFDADRDAIGADVKLIDDGSRPGFGEQILAVADQNGDGSEELVVAAVESLLVAADEHTGAGWVGLYTTPLADGAPSLASASASGTEVGGRFGNEIAAGDLDGDGRLDLVALTKRNELFINTPSTLSIFLGFEGERTAEDADASMTSSDEALASGGLAIRNVAGDAAMDLVVGWLSEPTAVAVFEGQ